MNHLVKILSSDSGDPRPKSEQFWHYVHFPCGDPATLCQSEYYGPGQSGCDYEEKHTERGGITCPSCLGIIKEIKAIKL